VTFLVVVFLAVAFLVVFDRVTFDFLVAFGFLPFDLALGTPFFFLGISISPGFLPVTYD
jgi:hypothetical protein